jgi:hypothetical protein
MTNRSFLVAALVALAACGRGEGDAAGETQPAGTQPAPTVQHQAAPQTGPNTPPADSAQPPAVPPARSYDECMVYARGSTESTREAAERACRDLPDAPK